MRKRALSASLVALAGLGMFAATTGVADASPASPSAADVTCSDQSVELFVVESGEGQYRRQNYYSSTGKITSLGPLHYGEILIGDYWCVNSYGNLWYHTVYSDDDGNGKGFVYSGWVREIH